MTDWAPRAPEVLARDQDTAVARYLAHSLELAEARAKAQELSATSREQRLDLARRTEARRREHEVVQRLSAQRIAEARALVESTPRAVLAHRSSWLRTQVATGLRSAGCTVVASLDNGAEASGAVIAEQPDLVLLEDLLPSMPGQQIARRARAFAPKALVAAQVSAVEQVEQFRQAGAVAVFTRSATPAVIVERLLRCLATGLEDYALD